MLNKIVTIICLALLIGEVLFFITNVIFKKRKERIAFIRSFKKGKCALIYFTAMPLYFIGHIHNGDDLVTAFFTTLNDILGMVVMKYDVSSISALMAEDWLYRVAIYFCYVLVVINAVLLTLSLTMQGIWCGVQAMRAAVTRKDKLYIFGNNPESLAVYRSDKKRCKVIVDQISDADAERLYMEKISYISTPNILARIKSFINVAKKMDREHVFLINIEDDEKNITLCRSVIDAISASDERVKQHLFLKMKVYVFGDPRYQTIYEDIVSDGYGCIHYVNKYHKVAVDFIDKYPLAWFMNEEQIDYDSSLVKNDVDINVMLIGFGKTNQQIFLTSIANNQFLTEGEGEPKLKKVNYFIFDKDHAENNKNLNHSYYRYKNECANVNPDEYLPLPSLPAEEKYFHLDINSREFYTGIREISMRSAKDKNYIIIAFGSDLENIDMAQKLVEKRDEWELHNLIIFVKVRVWHKEQTLLEQSGCYFIGNECDVVYNIDKITGDKILRMAKMRNEVYDLESDITANPDIAVDDKYIEQNSRKANRKWYVSKSQLERDSSLYGCLSLRSKLNLMNLDYCRLDENDIPPLTEREYLELYAKGDMPMTGKYPVSANGKPIISYGIDFANSRRRNMAIHEHQRWNSFMISKGMVPATRQQILNETKINDEGERVFTNGKSYALRRHGNITTFEGLVEFRRMIATRDGVGEEKKDVIKYDYQILDDAFWLLSENGYKIIYKRTEID